MPEKLNKLPKVEYVEVTPELARQWLNESMFERQRDVRPRAVKQYTEMMKKEEWQDWSILQFVQNGSGQAIGIDGQHRLLATEEFGKPVKFLVVTYYGNDYSNIVDRYIHTDKGRTRSSLDTIVAMGMSEKYDTPRSLINKAWAAVMVIAEGFGKDAKKTGVRLESTAIHLLENEGYLEVAKLYNELVGSGNFSGGFYRRSTMAIGLYTLKYAHKSDKIEERQVQEFWRGASKGIGEDPADPRRMLNLHCSEQPMYVSSKNKQEVVSLIYSIYFTAKCWNHFLAQKLVKQRKVATSDRLVIEGTPLGKEIKVE